ncbi:hypothetical protein DENSPDRAFT_837922 [Dentipellis sp. KUC8613]|nr:hypothetical protein DENSPDRAFT_837922 [Dentipellis sp. KUC8613]
MASEATPTTNSLGLDLANLKIDEQKPAAPAPAPSASSPADAPAPAPASEADKPATGKADEPKDAAREKSKPYVNHERVKTGGAPRDKLTDEELAERMAKIREQNEKIKQRRIDVQADEDAFKKTQAAERAKQAKARKIQETVDRTREQNAKRKMDKMQNREWDSGKKQGGNGNAPQSQSAADKTASSSQDTAGVPEESAEGVEGPSSPRQGGRGRGRGRGNGGGTGGHWRGGRGRGGGRGGAPSAGNNKTEKPADTPAERAPEAPAEKKPEVPAAATS